MFPNTTNQNHPYDPHTRLSKQPIYSTLFKRNSIFVTTVFLSAFSFSIGFDLATTAYWDYHNKGVSVFVFHFDFV